MKFLFVLLLVVTGCATSSQVRSPAVSLPFATPESGTFFASSEPMNLELSAPLKDLFAKVSAQNFLDSKKHSVLGSISFLEDGKKVEHQVKIKMRGFSTLTLCTFPKLEIKFVTVPADGYFKNTKSFDLNTHCAAKGEAGKKKFSELNHREELAYQFARALDIPTFSTRPIFIRYRATGIESVDARRSPFQAFAVEDMNAFEQRLNGTEIKDGNDALYVELMTHEKPEEAASFRFKNVLDSPMDVEDVSRIALFQALIGNNDWYIQPSKANKRTEDSKEDYNEGLWNVRVIEMKDGKWIPFPQDFNLAFMNSGLPTFILNEKVYNVASRPSREKIKATFVERREMLMKLTDRLTYDFKGRESIKKMLANFYNQLALVQEN